MTSFAMLFAEEVFRFKLQQVFLIISLTVFFSFLLAFAVLVFRLWMIEKRMAHSITICYADLDLCEEMVDLVVKNKQIMHEIAETTSDYKKNTSDDLNEVLFAGSEELEVLQNWIENGFKRVENSQRRLKEGWTSNGFKPIKTQTGEENG
jgi:hypothetical protein